MNDLLISVIIPVYRSAVRKIKFSHISKNEVSF